MQSWQTKGYNVDAMRSLARRVLPRPVFDFADGAAEDEQTMQRNEDAFGEIDLVPRPLEGPGERDLSVTLFDSKLSMPLLIGPTGLSGLFWPDGEFCAARAAEAASIGICLSHGSVCSLEDFSKVAAHPRWMQVFIYRDRGFTRELAERAANAGYDALVLTIDNQVLGNRERDLRNGFTIPPRFGLSSLAALATKSSWLWRMRGEFSKITFGNYARGDQEANLADLAAQMGELLDPSMSWDDVSDLRKIWKGPLLLKGVLHPEDAREAIKRGVDGLIVSNHGGRQLDGAISSIEALPDVVDAADGQIRVLIDGGIRRGSDVVRAIALGADACLIGRPQLWGLSVGGQAGVAHILDIYRREIDRVMGLSGVSSIAEIGPEILANPTIYSGSTQP